ncbi:hypothetical protein ATOBIA_N11970 [Atopobiaceae bacterium P1]|uniref:Uncharacterized protein n=1 Tax=Leptogranulimonas caecicola TaxID=2894156 RepID=A0AAU9CBD3_9ACTN|nr:hypothetical protein ATOBIA_N11970 [Atopobiaceae bacterium P1]BDC91237.1 hypothetical protein ATTO_11090 [Leptogranulimonas caecicola]
MRHESLPHKKVGRSGEALLGNKKVGQSGTPPRVLMGPRMSGKIDALKMGLVHMGVELGGGHIGMA